MGEAERWSSLVRPRGPLTYRIEQLTGLHDADLAGAPRLSDALAALARFVGRLPVVGQSVELDLAYLDRAGLRLENAAYDTFELGQLLVPGLPTYDLRQVSRALGVVSNGQHRALADADTAREVFLALLHRLGGLRLDTLMLVNRFAAGLNWSLAPLFVAAERVRTRDYLESAIGRRGEGRLPAPGGVPMPGAPADAPPPLVPEPGVGLLDADALVGALSADGELASQLLGYEERAEQLEMVRAVTAALDGDEHLVVEAATGTGKSLAYLLP